ncbi:MAG: hypothetical protein CMO80_00730 [Verrucomicrobiales bacterium]|nr:hypothetical protein [Verrucomicrobiales bacterium]|tara:strand:- start:15276 stop:15575 length:300 start_codon:yes stop_codon:yes gene_type:complete
MKDFEDKWHEATEVARQVEPAPIPEPPHGFAGRIVARAKEFEQSMPGWFIAFERFLFRFAGGVALAVVIAGGLQLSDYLAPPSLVPTVEHTVVERFLLL